MAKYIDADALREKMFHEAFEKDSQDQKWDSGCWIRYHMFENAVDSIPTADVVERKDLDKITEAHEEIGYEKGYADGRAARDAEIVRCKDCLAQKICRLESLPSVQSETSRIENALHGKSAEEQYDFLRWLMQDYGMRFTDTGAAVIEWLKERSEDG